MQKISIIIICALAMAYSWAGDVATFVNLGFSSDGTRFVFGQYGLTDGEYQAYADIFAVDVAKNAFIKEGLFTKKPSVATASIDARAVFAALEKTAAPAIQKLSVDSANQGRPLYVQAVDEPQLRKIVFRDFETETDYTVETTIRVEETGKNVKSSFYLVVTMKDKNGQTSTKTVGLPGFMRKGVSGYLVRRNQTDRKGSSLIFVIEKEEFEQNGSSTRFMVEALRL